jgi:hypothetical protein
VSDKYTYFAIVDRQGGVGDPLAVVREWKIEGGATREEAFTRNLTWEQTDRLYRIRSGRSYDEAEEISEAEVEKFIRVMTGSVQSSE